MSSAVLQISWVYIFNYSNLLLLVAAQTVSKLARLVVKLLLALFACSKG